jgi:hypothetical protein
MANDDDQPENARDGEEPEWVARRNVLRMGGMAAAAAAAAAVATAVNASPAGADPVYMQLGTVNDAGQASTVLKATAPDGIPTLLLGSEDTQQGVGLYSYGAQAGIFASTRGHGPALEATDKDSFFPGAGVGSAIKAHLQNQANDSPVIDVATQTPGRAIDARITWAGNPSGAIVATTIGSGAALEGHAEGEGSAVYARSLGAHAVDAATTNAANEHPAVLATSAGAGPAVRAVGRTVAPKAGVAAGNGPALDVLGRSTFSRSGVVTIPAGASDALTDLVPGGLFGASHVLATMQVNAALGVRAAVPQLSGAAQGRVRIFLTKDAPAGGVKVAWLVIG